MNAPSKVTSMTNATGKKNRSILQSIARRAMLDRGLLPEFSPLVLTELAEIQETGLTVGGSMRDLRNLAWCSIDNDSSLDLDQLTVVEALPDEGVKLLVAIADVDSMVKKLSAIDNHAQHNTTSVYTAARIFPMLPEKLSTNLTSLNFNADRLAIVIEMAFAADGSLQGSDIYQAMVKNHAKLAYNSVAAWLCGTGPRPQEIANVNGLEANLRMQDLIAQKLKNLRHTHGALDLETIEARPVFSGDELRGLEADAKNRARDIIEDFMIAANGVSARFLESRRLPSFRRVVRTPKRWNRIVELALQHDFKLPREPDANSLEQFLTKAKVADPDRFPDLSLSVIKLLGPGEYVVEIPGGAVAGHFGLAVMDYTHSTAPNRRFPDLITQRLLKAAIAGTSSCYTTGELEALAHHCTEMENAVKKVERRIVKSAAAMLLETRIGEQFDAIVTGASDKGIWVRITKMPVEGRLINGSKDLDVGHRLRVKLVSTDVERGFIDFKID